MTPLPLLESIQVGMPRSLGTADSLDPLERAWTSGIFKDRVQGLIHVGPIGLVGDGQADPVNHGGRDKAICVYSADHYPAWRTFPPLASAVHGAFGENFTLRGLCEKSVCVGDIFAIGTAVFQISQPRQPCWKLARKWKVEDMVDRAVGSGRTGWYFRVIDEGEVEAGNPLRLIDRLHPEWTVDRANRTMHGRPHDLDESAALAELPALSASWRATLTSRSRRP